jgi:phospholipid transport system substrate-binding protein
MKLFRGLAMGAMLAMTAATASLVGAAPAFADKKAEAYVETNANEVLRVLNEKSLTDEGRRAKFNDAMHKFANVRAIARRVLGQYGRNFPDGDPKFETYYKTFEVYALNVYEVQLDVFRGEAIKVTGSTDLDPRRSQVETTIKNSGTGKNTKVVWDVLQSTDGKNYRVRDVGISLGGAVLWLASDQQAQFESFLDRNNGKIDPLIGRINEMIADMDARKKAGTGSTIAKKAN